MRVKVNFSRPGMGIDSGTVARWLKSVGDNVHKGEAIAEIETAKAVQEITAPATGTLVEVLVPEGQEAVVNTPLALIDETGS